MMLLAEAALRSSLLTAAVWLALTLLRVRNPRSQMAAWSGVLFASIAMPLLMRWVPAAAVPVSFRFGYDLASPTVALIGPDGQSHQATPWLPLADLGITLILTARLSIGVLQGLRLVRRGRRIEADWTEGRDIRLSPDLAMPAAIGRTILLPADFPDWDPARRRAVLAHEASHVGRGDFYLLVLSSLYRAVFWFNPLSWWLRKRLADLAEANSDAAALSVAEDRLSYAQLLLDLAGQPRATPALLAMAAHATVRRRIERILAESTLPARLTTRKLALIMGCLIPTALAAASAMPAANRPQSGSEAALRAHIDQLQRGEIVDASMIDGMGAGVRNLLPQIGPGMAALGPITDIRFEGVGADGLDTYIVTHANGVRRWQIHLRPDGRIDSLWFSSL